VWTKPGPGAALQLALNANSTVTDVIAEVLSRLPQARRQRQHEYAPRPHQPEAVQWRETADRHQPPPPPPRRDYFAHNVWKGWQLRSWPRSPCRYGRHRWATDTSIHSGRAIQVRHVYGLTRTQPTQRSSWIGNKCGSDQTSRRRRWGDSHPRSYGQTTTPSNARLSRRGQNSTKTSRELGRKATPFPAKEKPEKLQSAT
jgi:hypothetical protein